MGLSRIRATLTRRFRYRITRGGILYLLAVVLTGGGAFLSANNLLFLIFSAMLALLLVSGFISRLVLSGLELELLLPEHVWAGTKSEARVRIRNLKRFTPSFSIELSGERSPVNDQPSILVAPVYFPLIGGRATVEAAIQVTFPRRGRHRENLFLISTKFPFGFLRKATTVALHRDTVVYPALAETQSNISLLDSLAGELETHFRGTGRDFYRIRPYELQDNARHVDWKSTAHTGQVQIREFSRDRQRTVEIYLDRQIEAEWQAWFERAVESCAYLAWNLAEIEAELHFRSQRFAFTLPDDGEVYAILKFLALVEPLMSPGDLPAEPPIDDSSLQIYFSVHPKAFEDAGWANAFDLPLDGVDRAAPTGDPTEA